MDTERMKYLEGEIYRIKKRNKKVEDDRFIKLFEIINDYIFYNDTQNIFRLDLI